MKIVTLYDPPPIPDRRWDWTAIDDDTFDPEMGSQALGYGRTEAEAKADLLDQLELRAEEAEDGAPHAICKRCGAAIFGERLPHEEDICPSCKR